MPVFTLATPEQLRSLKRAVPGVVSGFLLTLAFPPLGWGLFAWFALIPLYVALTRTIATNETPRPRWASLHRVARPFAGGFVFGTMLFSCGAWWVTVLGLPAWAILTFWCTLPFPLLIAVLVALLPHLPASLRPLCFAAFWTLGEGLRSLGEYAFPWLFLSSTQAHALPILQLVSVTGQWGLTFLIALVNGLLAEAWLGRAVRHASLRFGAVVLTLLAGVGVSGFFAILRTQQENAALPQRTVAAVQGNVPRDGNGKVARETVLPVYLALTREAARQMYFQSGAPPTFIVWPEEVMDRYLSDPAFFAAVPRLANELQVPIVLGSFEIDRNRNYRNAALLVSPNGSEKPLRYDKNRLVPIGEYFPLRTYLGHLYGQDRVPKQDFIGGTSGDIFPIVSGAARTPTGVLICYEQVFPYLARQRVRDGAQILAVLTSDETFGISAGPLQHADQAIVRAVETRRAIVRAATTGVTQIISPTGEVQAILPQGKRGFVTAVVSLRGDRTLSVRWGDWFLWVAAFFALTSVILALRRLAGEKNRI